MKIRNLGPDGLAVSAIGLGCMGMSQLYGPVDDTESVATLHHAIDSGITFLDTAMSYGTGHNEQLLARVLATRRNEVVVATKFGIVRSEQGVRVDGRPENVRGYCEASLSRLGIDHIDLYYAHRVDPQVPVEETVGAMAELVAEGKVGRLGLSEANVEQLERAVATHPIAALQSEWSLWWRDIEDEVLPAARRLGVGIVAFSPLGRGFLTGTVDVGDLTAGDARRSDPRFTGEGGARNRALLAELDALAGERGATAGQLALAWLLAQGADVVPIPGTKRRSRLDENAAAADLRLDAADLARLETLVPRAAWSGDRVAFGAPATTRVG